jgi:hypothetical protein
MVQEEMFNSSQIAKLCDQTKFPLSSHFSLKKLFNECNTPCTTSLPPPLSNKVDKNQTDKVI